ncbi:HD-GYP domain-containing protein [Acidobacteriota bacterium]
MTDRRNVLIAEDNEEIRARIVDFFQSHNIACQTLNSSFDLVGHLEQNADFSLLLLSLNNSQDINLRQLEQIRESIPLMDICVLGLDSNPNLAVSLLVKGLIDHIGSLDNMAGLYAVALNAVEKRKLIDENLIYSKKLQQLKVEQKENRKRTNDLEEIYDSTLENLMTALDMRDVETFGHSRTVAKYSQVLAQLLGIKSKKKLDNIRKGALLHDVGKIAIPDSILKKPSSLTPREWKKIRLHPALGFGLIKEIKLVNEVGSIILHHHERFDGTGYPGRLKGEKIPLEARIFALADALDAITSHRPYRKRREFKIASEEIQAYSGTQFDPQIVDAFHSLSLVKWEKIRFETTKLLPSIEEMINLLK